MILPYTNFNLAAELESQRARCQGGSQLEFAKEAHATFLEGFQETQKLLATREIYIYVYVLLHAYTEIERERESMYMDTHRKLHMDDSNLHI